MKNILLSIFFTFLSFGYCSAENIVWGGEVKSDGTPTEPIHLILNKNYQIRVSGAINLGKWWQGTKELANDGCYEYNGPQGPTKLESIKNSLNVSICENNSYNTDHVYTSLPFVARQNKVFFWVKDENYDDNTGTFNVKIIQISE